MPTDSNDILRMFVDRRFGGENGSGHSNLFNELSVQGSEIKFYENKKMPQSINSRLWNLAELEINGFANGVVNYPASVKYDNSPETVLKKYGTLLCADVQLAASDSDNLRYSRFIRYYWSKDDETWLPMEMVFLYVRERKADPFF